jgi:hypothetical protein
MPPIRRLSITSVLLALVFASAPAEAPAVSFSPPTNFTDPHGPFSVAVSDFNGDAKSDLAVADNGGGVSILLGNGAGGFTVAGTFAAGN